MNHTKARHSWPHKACEFSLLWLVFGALQFILAYLSDKNSLHEHSLLLTGRLGLQCQELSLLAPALAAVCLLGGLICALMRRLPLAAGEALAAIAAFGVALVALVYYLGDWVSLYMTGQFSGYEGMAMFGSSAWQLFQHLLHFNPALGIVVPLLCLGLATLLRSLLAVSGKLGPRMRRTIIVTALACFAANQGLARLHEPKFSKNQGQGVHIGTTVKAADLLLTLHDYRTGPLLRLQADLYNRLEDSALGQVNFDTKVERRLRTPLSDYVAAVDRSAFAPYNVIVVLVESLRPDALMSFGGKAEVMPNVERLAKRSQLFLDSYTQASHSNYADSCILSSQYPLRDRRYHLYPKNPLYPRVLIYDILSALGYRTSIISSQNENWGQMRNYLDTGSLDLFFDAETYDGPTYVPRFDTGFARFIRGSKRAGKIDDRFTIDQAIKWIDAENRLFFTYINLQNSHVPYEIPADFHRRFSPAKLDFEIRFNSFPTDKVDEVKGVYFDSLAYVDQQLGRLFAHLEQKQLLEKTIIVISGDTGQAFYEHGFAGHANQLFDEVLRVPLVVFVPGLAPAAHRSLAQHIDVPPTLLRQLNLPAHANFQGRDLFDQSGRERNAFLLAQSPLAHQYAVVNNGHKLIYDYRLDSARLFDLRNDPAELVDVAPDRREIVERLRQKLLVWRAAQIDYYESAAQMVKYYPPFFKD